MRRFTTGSHLLAIAIWLALATLSAPAHASHDGDGIDPDNTNQSLSKHSLTAKGDSAYTWAKYQLERSVITTSQTTGDADLALYDGDYGQEAWWGQTVCTDRNHNAIGWPTTCDDMTVKLDSANLAPYPVYVWQHVACHELGHTGDLGHRSSSDDTDDNSCMRTDNETPLTFDSHDLSAIASTF